MWKYEEQHGTCGEGCPPAKCGSYMGVAYRFTQDPPTAKDFVPVCVMYPEGRKSCSGYGLSLFDTLANARRRYVGLRKKGVDVVARLGTLVAKLDVPRGQGHATVPPASGHFDFHELAGADLSVLIVHTEAV